MLAAPFMLVHPAHVVPVRVLYHSSDVEPLTTMARVDPTITAAIPVSVPPLALFQLVSQAVFGGQHPGGADFSYTSLSKPRTTTDKPAVRH